jgi:hypothetical protein
VLESDFGWSLDADRVEELPEIPAPRGSDSADVTNFGRTSGWMVDVWMPYACRHSLTVLAFSINLPTPSSSTTTCTEAIDFLWSSRQI